MTLSGAEVQYLLQDLQQYNKHFPNFMVQFTRALGIHTDDHTQRVIYF